MPADVEVPSQADAAAERDTKTGASYLHEVTAILKSLAQQAGQEARKTISRLLMYALVALVVAAAALVLMIAGVVRLEQALVMAMSRWTGDPIVGTALSGVIVLAIPLVGLLLMRHWLRTPPSHS